MKVGRVYWIKPTHTDEENRAIVAISRVVLHSPASALDKSTLRDVNDRSRAASIVSGFLLALVSIYFAFKFFKTSNSLVVLSFPGKCSSASCDANRFTDASAVLPTFPGFPLKHRLKHPSTTVDSRFLLGLESGLLSSNLYPR